mgnify:CR=1 FL=1
MDTKYIKSKPNTLLNLFEKYPDKQWYWKGISSNPNITMEIIEKYPNNAELGEIIRHKYKK